jgi:hypothetical protein
MQEYPLVTSLKIADTVHDIEQGSGVGYIHSRICPALPGYEYLEFLLGRLPLPFCKCFAQSIGDKLGQRGIRFQRGLLRLKHQVIREIDRDFHGSHRNLMNSDKLEGFINLFTGFNVQFNDFPSMLNQCIESLRMGVTTM